jgi:hypothetical protein
MKNRSVFPPNIVKRVNFDEFDVIGGLFSGNLKNFVNQPRRGDNVGPPSNLNPSCS